MVRSLILFSLLAISASAYSMLELEGIREVDFAFTQPSKSSSTIFSIKNSSLSESITINSSVINGSDYSFLGGSYPGVGGDCGTVLPVGSTCLIAIEFSPSVAGDIDADLILNYDIGALTAQELKARLDGHSALIGSGADCSAIAPSVSEVNSGLAEINDNSSIELVGSNFTPLTTVSVTGLLVSNIQFHSPQKLSLDIATGADVKKYNMVVSNECSSITITDAIDVRTSLWVDLRVAANVAALNPIYDSARISSYIVDPSFGMQLTGIVGNDWRKGLRFDGYCGSINKDFDIVVYRSARVKRAMFSLFSDSTPIAPSAGSNYHQRQFVGMWNYGTRVAIAYGSQRYEVGGVTWTQTFPVIDTLAGQFIRYNFKHAGQNGYQIEMWEVDSSFNDIQLLRSFTSDKTQTPATNVCPGIVAYTEGDADYYITGVRIK